jgi:hypothetical protein
MAIIPGTIVVNFKFDVCDVDIDKYLKKEGVVGTNVSTLLNRYVIEVYPGKEQEYIDKFKKCEMISRVHEYFVKGKITPIKRRENKSDKEEKKSNDSGRSKKKFGKF